MIKSVYMCSFIFQCNVFEHRNYRCVYKMVNNLVYMIATDLQNTEVNPYLIYLKRQNALSLMSFIDVFVETLELYFSKLVCS